MKARKYNAEMRRERLKTGGGSAPAEEALSVLIMQLIPDDLEGAENPVDSDSRRCRVSQSHPIL